MKILEVDMTPKKSEDKGKTVLAQLFANGGDLSAAAKAANVSFKTAKSMATSSYIERHPEVKEWYETTFTSKDLAVEKLEEQLAKIVHIPDSVTIVNPAMAKVKLSGIELAMKQKGLLTENKNINVSITDYTEQLKEAWRLREERTLKNVTLESKNYLPAPANQGGQPSEEQKGS